jgi:transcriptional regulator with XRE-family HTH domain
MSSVFATSTNPADLGVRFGAAVRSLREGRGWSQERLAGRAELNRSYMGEIERATVMPSLATAAKLAQALEVPLSVLLSQCESESGNTPGR